MNASSSYERKKEPEKVRRALLDRTAQLAASHGLNGVTLDAVARAAGVTKGGLLHHFPSKQALIHGMFADLLDRFDATINAFMVDDAMEHGRFTRAYVEAAFNDHVHGTADPSAILAISMVGEPELQREWSDWLARRLERHAHTDGDALCEVVRLAADRIWFAALTSEAGAPVNFSRAREAMLALTRPKT